MRVITKIKSGFCRKIVFLAAVWLSAILPLTAGAASQTPLSYFAVFYQNLLEFSTCATMSVNGLVHCNTNIDVGAGGSSILTFNNTVTSVGTISAPPNNGATWGNPTNFNSSWRTIFNGSPSNLVYVPSIQFSIPAANLHNLIEMPTTNDSATDLGRARLCNQAQVVLTVSNMHPTDAFNTNMVLTVKIQKAPDSASVPGADAAPTIITYTNGNDSAHTNLWLSPAALATNLPFLSLTNLFYDRREGTTNVTTQIDIGLYKQWLTNAAGPAVGKFPADGSDGYPTILFVSDARNTATTGGHKLDVVRIKNGQSPPANGGLGFSVATPNPLYVWGNYNQTNNALLGTTNTSYGTVPCAFFCDALTILSPNWSDAHTLTSSFSTGSSSWDAVPTTVNAAILTGNVPSTGNTMTTFSGGVQNLVRLLEDWNLQTLTLNTAVIDLYPSTRATGVFINPGTYYEPPTRQYNHDRNFQNLAMTPPGMPMAATGCPLIFIPLQNAPIFPGDPFILNVQAAGYGQLSYQWAINGTNVDGATNNSLALTNVQVVQPGIYTITVSDGIETNTSMVADFTGKDFRPIIWPQPVDHAAFIGSNVTFTSAATSLTPMWWQWQWNGTDIDGATNSNLTLTNLIIAQAGTYSVVASNAFGSRASSNAALYVYPPSAPAMDSLLSSADSPVQFTVDGVTGVTYVVQASTDLVNWDSLMTNVAPFDFADTNALNLPQRFYRVVFMP